MYKRFLPIIVTSSYVVFNSSRPLPLHISSKMYWEDIIATLQKPRAYIPYFGERPST